MLSNTLNMIVVIIIFMLSSILSLIMLYSNPLGFPTIFIGSLYYLSASFIILAISKRVDFSIEKDEAIKIAYIIMFSLYFINAVVMSAVVFFDSPTDNINDTYKGATTYLLSSIIILYSIYITYNKVKNE